MPSNVVKCSNCNVVINELLAFVHNKISVMDDESISRICSSAFSESEILTAKNLLYDSMPTTKRKIIRKNGGKGLRDLDDIICLIRGAETEDIPVFVAKDLEKLPPVLFDHVDVTRLLKDIVKMRQDLNVIAQDYAKVEQLDVLKSEVESLKRSTSIYNGRNVNKRRGACLINSFEYHSGPMGLPPLNGNNSPIQHSSQHVTSSPESIYQEEVQEQYYPLVGNSKSPSQLEKIKRASKTVAVTHRDQLSGPLSPQPLSATMPTASAIHTSAPCDNRPTKPTKKSMADVVREGEWKSQTSNEEWIRVERKRRRNRFIGNKGRAILEPGNNFKAADTKIPVYIYNVAKGVSVCDITGYIKKKSDIDVCVEKINMKIEKDYESFKIFVPKHKLEIFMSDDFWPEGVAYRRFIDFRNRDKGNAYKDVVTNIPLNGK